MVYKELVEETAIRSGLTNTVSRIAVDAVFDIIKEQIEAGTSVSILGFGRFIPKTTKSHYGINPHTQKMVLYPSKRRVVFHVNRDYRVKINNDNED